ncbi:MAG: hypothetical protein GTN38_01885 [Candidatus Aenigmarchaeota archaeon]|nr:hypothetical protein [Candidatus Aenigmarchaeota archaeon]NIP40307.1 hypothetical protein [Candidatus Aenigmarchaeota archaeon]NIQ17799.1 hypothetical protein [Candidatus Aenigmarchaeota archaeon]NIS73182.1 hypothetical protein [Candidatus Aenigmarchaeota archaeon]
MNYKILIMGIIIGLIAGSVFGYFAFSSPKLQICPDEWYINKMPPEPIFGERQYFIINGKRAEISSFDIDWVKKNCNIEPKIVV